MSLDPTIKIDFDFMQTRVGQLLDATGKHVVDEKVFKDLDARILGMISNAKYETFYPDLSNLRTDLHKLINAKEEANAKVTSDDLTPLTQQINALRGKILGIPSAATLPKPSVVAPATSSPELEKKQSAEAAKEEEVLYETVYYFGLRHIAASLSGEVTPYEFRKTLANIEKLPTAKERVEALVHYINTNKSCQSTRVLMLYDGACVRVMNTFQLHLPNLRNLVLFDCDLREIPPFVFRFPGLQMLQLQRGNEIDKIALNNQAVDIVTKLPHLKQILTEDDDNLIPEIINRHLEKNQERPS